MPTPPDRRRPALRARLVLLRREAGTPQVLLTYHRHPHRSFWCFPGGVVEEGETLADAAVRECREETGLRVTVGGVCYMQDRPEAESLDIFFTAAEAAGEAALGADPDRPAADAAVLAELRWVPLAELPALTVLPEGLARALARGALPAWGLLPLPE